MNTVVIMWGMFSAGIVVMALFNLHSYDKGYKHGFRDGRNRKNGHRDYVENVVKYPKNTK